MKQTHAGLRGSIYAGATPYVVALVAAAVCTALCYLPYEPIRQRFAFLPLYPAVALAGFLGGFRPAMFGAVVGAAVLYFSHPALQELGNDGIVICMMFLGVAAVMGLLSEALLIQRGRALKVAESTAELRRVQERLEQIAAVSPDCLTILDLEKGRPVYVNRAVKRLVGYDPDEALARSASDILQDCHPDDRVQVDLALNALENSEPAQVIEFEARQRHRDGDYRWFRHRLIALGRGPDGRLKQLVAHSEDVSDRRAMIEALNEHAQRMRDQAEQLELAMDAAQLGAWRYDPGTRVEFLSVQARRNLGFAVDAAVGFDDLLGIIDGADRERVDEAMTRALENGAIYDCEYRVKWPDGSVHWVASRGRVTDGEAPMVIGVNQDITKRKLAEMEREQLLLAERAARSEAERANRLKDEFLATVSHELRTPLTAILGWASILEEICPAGEAQQGVEVISRNARAQRQLVNDLLDMSRILSGKVRLEIGPVLLPQLIDAVIETVTPAALARGVTLTRWFEGCDEPIQADADRLQQVIWNLLSNGVKFTPAGGQVRVVARCAPDGATFEVHDTGQGIAPEFVPYVFERFRQEDATATRKHGGLGLGLAIVKHLVELHGGFVSAASEGLGKGAVFTVQMPHHPRQISFRAGLEAQSLAPSLNGGRHAAPKETLAGCKIVVIDDEADTRHYLQRVLHERGASVSVAESAAEGLRQIQADRPHAIICDISMPGEDGYSFIRKLRALSDPALAGTPTAALTAFARAEDRERALATGFDQHCPKPVEPSDLVALVRGLSSAV